MTTPLFFLLLILFNLNDAQTKGSWTDFTGSFQMYGSASSFSYVTGTVTWSWTQSKMYLNFNTGTAQTWSETYAWNTTRGFTGSGLDSPQYLFTLGSACSPNCNSASMQYAMPLLNPSGGQLSNGVASKKREELQSVSGCLTYTPLASASASFLESMSASSTQVCSFTLQDGRTFVMTSFTKSAATITQPSGCQCSQAVDIEFLIDHSGSIDDNEMRQFKNFVTNFLGGLTISPTAINAGAVYFSIPSKSGTNWPITGSQQIVDSGMAGWAVPCVSGSNQCQGSGTATGYGIRIAADALYASTRQVPKILMTLTDGATNTNRNGGSCCSSSGSDRYTGCNPDIDSAITYLKSKKAAAPYAHNLTLIAAGVGQECTSNNKGECYSHCKYTPHLLRFADGIASNVLSVNDWASLQSQVSNLMSMTCTTSNNVAQQTCLANCPGLCVCGACIPPTGCTNNTCFNYTLVNGVCRPTANPCPYQTCKTCTCDNDANKGTGAFTYSPVDCSAITSGCDGCIKYSCAMTGSSAGQCTVPDSSACPTVVDCAFNPWGSWTPCTATCGGGTTTATRTVSRQASGCGAACSLSPTSTTIPCNTQSCATPCTVTPWGPWGPCNVSCGGGTQFQTRNITANATNGGAACPALSQSQSCGSNPCPVDCLWYLWGDWSPCTKTCGTGSTTQTRSIQVQAAYGGQNCSGLSTNTTVCATNGCPVDCVWSIWGDYNTCSATCGQGTQSRNRTQTQVALNGGRACDGNTSSSQTCTIVECPIPCAWGAWSTFSACTKSCGTGNMTQTRSITQVGMYGGAACVLSDGTNTTICNTQNCPIDCIWGGWSSWTDCTKTCGGGTRFMNRSIAVEARYNGIACTGAFNITEPCNSQGCPVNCTWGPFGSFSPCTKTCGGGTMSQYRTVAIAMANGGVDCIPSENVNTTDCFTQDCPIDCVWSPWGDWSDCTLTCGSGTRTNNRTITTQANIYGVQCGTLNVTVQNCNTQNCPIPCVGAFGAWSEWHCLDHNRTRVYAITTPAQFGGAECPNVTGAVDVEGEDKFPGGALNCQPIDCVGEWGEYSNCSCLTNDRYRFYTITTPPQNDGAIECPYATGYKEIDSTCIPQECPVNCSGAWGEFSVCSCVTLTQSQIYIQTVAVLYGGVSCPYANNSVNTTNCVPEECPVDCEGQWSSWGDCSCTTNNQNRTYTITTPREYAGRDCDFTTGALQTQNCNPTGCPQNCSGEYSPWTTCDCTTNQTSRKFTVTVPMLNNGVDCNQTDGGVQFLTCTPEEIDDLCPVNCTGEWSSWGDCSCSNNQQNRTFALTRAAKNGGVGCSAEDLQVEYGTCTPVDCPVPCNGSWAEWGPCDCTLSTKTREYEVHTDLEHGGDPCPQGDGDIDTTGCTPSGCPVNCSGSFGNWSDCSCVTHTAVRTYTVYIEKQNAGEECEHATGYEEVNTTCDYSGCPVDCDGEWSEWSSCTCDGRSQDRYFIANVTVANGGQVCPGNQSQQCEPVGCAVDCSGHWGDWSNCPCPASGNASTRTRVYIIDTPASNGGLNCTPGEPTSESCTAPNCPVNCTGEWSVWGKCSCKDRIHKRTFRVLVNQSNGGTNCEATDNFVGVGACEPTGCDPRPVCNSTEDCIDSSMCTQNLCVYNASDEQYHCDWSQPVVCNDNSLCTEIDTCDDLKGCVYIDLDCNDNNACTDDFCSNTTGCYHTNVTCTVNASDFCSTPICDVTTGCNLIQRECPGEAKDNCTQKICNPNAASASVACEDVQLCGFDPAVVIGIAGGAIAGIAVAAGTVALAAASGASYAIATQSGAMAGATVIESPLYVGDGTSGVNMLPH